MKCLTIALIFLSSLSSFAGVYGDLEFGDSRKTVTKKMSSSQLVEQTVNSTFLGRTGLNGIFKCKAKLAGLTYHLYFGWNESGGLNEITLRSGNLNMSEYGNSLRTAWNEAATLFSKVYNHPAQKTGYPTQRSFQDDFKGHQILISHVWHKGEKQSILMGPGIDQGKCFLTIRFVNKRVVLPSSR